MIVQLKNAALLYLNVKLPFTVLHKAATFLCPSLKHWICLNSAVKEETYKFVRLLLHELTKVSGVHQTNQVSITHILLLKRTITVSDFLRFENDCLVDEVLNFWMQDFMQTVWQKLIATLLVEKIC